MAQYALRYAPSYSGQQAWLAQLEILRAAVTHLTPKEVLFELNISKSTLSEALNERNDKRWAAEWTHVVKSMLAQRYDDVSQDLLLKICESDLEVTSLEVGEPRELTPEELAAGYRAELARMGEQGKAAIARVTGKGKRK